MPSSSSMKTSTKRGVELFAGDPAQLDDRVVARHRRAVGVARGHHVVGVGDGDDPRQLGDVVAGQAARVALAVDPLVVGEDDLRHRAVAVERGDDAGALLGVALDQHPVLVGERHVGLEDAVGEDELADVVQQRGDVDQLLLLARVAGPLGDRPRVARHRGASAGRSSGPAGRACAASRSTSRPGSWPAACCAAPARRPAAGRAAAAPSRYWKVIRTTPKRAIAGDPDHVVDEGDARPRASRWRTRRAAPAAAPCSLLREGDALRRSSRSRRSS